MEDLKATACGIQDGGSREMIPLELLDGVTGFPLQALPKEVSGQILKQNTVQ